MNPVRSPWLISLALAVFVVVSGQVRVLDAWDAGPDSDGDSVSCSVLDDSFVAVTGVDSPDSIRPTAAGFLDSSESPRGRLVVSELFRPPISRTL